MLSEDQSVDLVNDDSSIFIVETPSDLASVTFRGSHIQHHKDPIESEIQYQVSIFHFKKKGQEKKLNRDDLMFKAHNTAYWLVKEKV